MYQNVVFPASRTHVWWRRVMLRILCHSFAVAVVIPSPSWILKCQFWSTDHRKTPPVIWEPSLFHLPVAPFLSGLGWVWLGFTHHHINGNFKILKWRYCTIFQAIFCGYIPLHRTYMGLIYGRYLQFRFLKWPLITMKLSHRNCYQS